MHDNWVYSRIRHQELLRQAAQTRLAKEAQGWRQSIIKRFLAHLGGLMIAWGRALHQRYAPARPVQTAFSIPHSPSPIANQNMVTWDTGDVSCEREPAETLPRENGFFNSTQTRRHSPSRKKSNG
jgi:hypothetical protein